LHGGPPRRVMESSRPKASATFKRLVDDEAYTSVQIHEVKEAVQIVSVWERVKNGKP
jgi:hypothetical protein